MVANPAIAAEGFKNVTVKFLSKSAEPQVHRFEYEQGMLFLRFPKWIQEKLKSLKKTLDFSALPLVKVLNLLSRFEMAPAMISSFFFRFLEKPR